MPATTTARILTVDDNPIVRADLRLMLEDAGFEVVPDARDGIEAVDLAHEHKPDLVLIESMLRSGSSEREIVAALDTSFNSKEPATRGMVRRIFGRLA